MLDLPMRSWTAWLADALHIRHACIAHSGHRAADALGKQIPRLAGTYYLGCVYLGVNDVRAPDWHAEAFERDLGQICPAMSEHACELLLLTIPTDLGRPRISASAISAANTAIEHVAARHGAHLLDLRELRGWTFVLPDAVHLTARGEAHVARLACRKLAAAGVTLDEHILDVALRPFTLGTGLHYACGPYARALSRNLRTRARTRLSRASRVGRRHRRPLG